MPEIPLQEGVDPMNQHGHDQFTVEFASQTVFNAGVCLMDAHHGLELFEQQFNLPTHTIKIISHHGGQPFTRHISDQKSPIAKSQMLLTDGAAFF